MSDRQHAFLIRLFGITATGFLVVLVSMMAVRVYLAQEAGGRNAASHFEWVNRELTDAYLKARRADTPEFRATVKSLDGEAGLAALLLRGPEGVRYVFDATREIVELIDGRPSGRVNRPSLHADFSAPFAAEPATTLTAVYRLVPRDYAFRIVRDALFLVIAFLLACAIALLLIVTLTPQSSGAEQVRWQNGKLGMDHDDAGDPPSDGNSYGLEPQEMLGERLQAELERAAAFETDLSLILGVLLAAEAGSDDSSARVASLVRGMTALPELAFAYGEAGFGLILPETNLDAAIAQLEPWRRSAEQAGLCIAIGIGDRASRHVDRDRLLLEVEHALGRAMAKGGGQLVAFRADPARYRVLQASAQR